MGGGKGGGGGDEPNEVAMSGPEEVAIFGTKEVMVPRTEKEMTSIMTETKKRIVDVQEQAIDKRLIL